MTPPATAPAPPYAELHALSNFSFLQGASHPEELVERAARLGYRALALTDECSLAGVVRAHAAAQGRDLHLIVGSAFRLACGLELVVLAMDRAGYARLSALISAARAAAPKGEYRIDRSMLADGLPGCLVLWLAEPERDGVDAGAWLQAQFGDRCALAVRRQLGAGETAHVEALAQLAASTGIERVAVGSVRMHARGRRALADAVTAIRLGTTVADAGTALHANGEAHLRPRARLARLYPPALLAATTAFAARCMFSLDELAYEYPDEAVPAGYTPSGWLRSRVEAGAAERWPAGPPPGVRAQIDHELDLIEELQYEAYFLTVDDLVRYAREQGILCQGRGSAANSAVCYCLGITAVDPGRSAMLFERFISRERGEPPDIDVDFEHHRREEVIQHIYRRYGADRVALAATVIRYRPKSALRDLGAALGLAPAQVERLAEAGVGRDGRVIDRERVRETGFDPDAPTIHRVLTLAEQIQGFPRHLSQHVGGLVIARRPLAELVPIENAAMAGRTVIQWDKDDLDAAGLMKIDCLALGMLTVLRNAFDLIHAFHGRSLDLATLPAADDAVFAMIQRADTVGVFQIESRAQMSMLPRLRPASFYDLVIEISIVRPGPIQGEMVHPYLRRRQGLEAIEYGGPEIERVLGRTLGVPLFQEQVIEMAMVAADFSPGEADQLRRAMAAWRKAGDLAPFERRLVEGMTAHGYSADFAHRMFAQIRGFAGYGFPESHAASFALLAWASAWLKHHYPAALTAALLNAQPMGFYGPAQLVRDGRDHGVTVLPVDVDRSQTDASLEADGQGGAALRLGLDRVRGLARAGAEAIPRARPAAGFRDVADLAARAGLDRGDLEALAEADALHALAGERTAARWAAQGVQPPLPLFADAEAPEPAPALRAPPEGESIRADYASTDLTLRRHPLALLRPHLPRWASAAAVAERADASAVVTGGLVVTRQQPATASGVTFLTLEDDTGALNVIVRPPVVRWYRPAVYTGRLLAVTGCIQRQEAVIHVVAHRLDDYSAWLGRLDVPSRDFG
jgi:error-prone DNA polymerase